MRTEDKPIDTPLINDMEFFLPSKFEEDGLVYSQDAREIERSFHKIKLEHAVLKMMHLNLSKGLEALKFKQNS